MNRLCMAAMLLIGISASAKADEPVAPPLGAVGLIEVQAHGVQVYACEAKEQGYKWILRGPDATLFDGQGRKVGTHTAGPRWTLADGSSVTAEKTKEAAASEAGAVAWLLLQVKSHEGAGQLAEANWVRRAQTHGGAAPKDGCDADHNGETARIHYSAIYQFFR